MNFNPNAGVPATSPQGFQQNPGAFGGQGMNFNPNAGVPATSPQGFQQNPGAFGGQGLNFNPHAGVPATFHQGFQQNPGAFGGQGVNFNPNFTVVLVKLDTVCQTNYKIGASLLAALPPGNRGGERTQATIQTIQTYINNRGLSDSQVVILEVTNGRFFHHQKFSQLQLIDSWTSGSKETFFANTVSDKNIVNFLNGNTGTSQWPAGLWKQSWKTGALQFFVIYNNEIFVIFPTNDQNLSLFPSNSTVGSPPEIKMDSISKGARAMKTVAEVYGQQQPLWEKMKFWKTPTHQKFSNWADIITATANVMQ
jgi:hypothetical protein